MNGDDLGLAMMAAVDNLDLPFDRESMYKAMGNAVVTYIQTHASVSVTTTTPGVQAGPSAAPGTGTGTIA